MVPPIWTAPGGLGVSDSVSFEGSTSSELDPPTVAINSVSSLNGSALVYGLWNGDIFDSPTLSVTVGSDTYTYPGSSEISLNGENWNSVSPGMTPFVSHIRFILRRTRACRHR